MHPGLDTHESHHPRATTAAEVDAALNRLAQSTPAHVSRDTFHRQVLDELQGMTGATSTAIWHIAPNGTAERLCESCGDPPAVSPHASFAAERRSFIESVARTRLAETTSSSQRKTSTGHDDDFDDVQMSHVAAPVIVNDVPVNVVEVLFLAPLSTNAARGCQQLLAAVCDLVGDYWRSSDHHRLQDREQFWISFSDMTQTIQKPTGLNPVAASIVQACRPLLECDRVSVVMQQGTGCRLIAVSGIESIDRRAQTVRCLEHLARLVMAGGESLDSRDDSAELAPQLHRALQAYLDVSHVRGLQILPMVSVKPDAESPPNRPFALLVVEHFRERMATPLLRGDCDRILRSCGLVLDRARRLDAIPLFRWLHVFAALRTRSTSQAAWSGWLKLAAMCCGIAAIVTAGLWMQVPLNIRAAGQLRPREERVVFAPWDGITAHLSVDHGQSVKANDILMELRSSALDSELERLTGEWRSAQQRWAAVQAARTLERNSARREESAPLSYAGQEEELKQQMASLESQLGVVRSQLAQAQIKSPIDGQVMTWGLSQILTSRPVARGQALMTIGRLNGDWVLELQIEDRDLAAVQRAWDEQSQSLAISYRLPNDLKVRSEGQLEALAIASEQQEGRIITKGTASLGKDLPTNLRPGTPVEVQLHCGDKPAGYVWLRGVIDAIRNWWW